MKEEEGKRHAAVEAFSVAKKSIQDLKNKLLEEERERKSVVSALDSAERQPRANECSYTTPRISYLPLKPRSLPSRKSLRKPKRQGMMHRGLERKRKGLGGV